MDQVPDVAGIPVTEPTGRIEPQVGFDVALAHADRIAEVEQCRGLDLSESCLRNWLHQADVEDGAKPGVTKSESTELREARKRVRLLEQENEVLRRAAAYFAQARLPGK